MITAFRRYLETWVVRAFFLIMVLSFISWGVGDVIRMIGTPTWVAKVGSDTIEGTALQTEYQRALSQATRDLPPGQEATPELKRRVGDEALQRMIGQSALSQELRDLHILTPEPAVAAMIRTTPSFRGADGKFSRPMFEAVLRNNGLSEARFLEMMRGDLAQRQLLGAITAGASAPETLVAPIYSAEFEKRSADMVEFPLSAAPTPPTPDEATVRRWYDNHLDLYATPEYRRIKAIELSPQTLGKEIEVTDDDLRAAYEQHRATYVTVSKRSAQVISVADEAKANTLTEKWRAGADWAAMQEAAQAEGASAVAIDDSTIEQFPDADLAKTVFATNADSVSAPVKGALGWYVVKVTKVIAGSEQTLEQVKDQVRARVVADKAADLMYDRANKVDNLLANGTSLDELPGDLALAAVAGTLDPDGNTLDGLPAPIPGSNELRAAIVTATFQSRPGDPPRLTEVQTPSTGGSAYFALTVEDITPAGNKPYEEVKARAAEDWIADQQRHSQEQAAAQMLTAVKGGQAFSDAATVAGVTPRLTPVVTRAQAAEGMPAELQRVLFTLKRGKPTMLETAEGFVVAVPAEIIDADSKSDPAGYDQTRVAIARSVAGDLANVFTEAVRLRANPRIHQENLNQIVQP